MEERARYHLDRKITVDEYQRLGREGFFPDDVRLELIDGEVREMPSMGPSHAWIVDRLALRLIRQLGDTHHIRCQGPVDLDMYNEPEPDILVARPDPVFARRHPNPPDVLLAIEVSDSTLREDRRHKIPRYARSGIPEAWIVDVGHRQVRLYSKPAGITYQSEEVLRPGQAICSTTIEELDLTVDQVFEGVDDS